MELSPPLAHTRLDDARAVGANEARLGLLAQRVLNAHHVLLRDTLSDAHDEGDLRLDGLEDGRSCRGRRHKDNRRVGVGDFDGLLEQEGR